MILVFYFLFFLKKEFEKSWDWRQEYEGWYSRTGFASSLCPQPGHCLDPHSWCSSSLASMRSELLILVPKLLLLPLIAYCYYYYLMCAKKPDAICFFLSNSCNNNIQRNKNQTLHTTTSWYSYPSHLSLHNKKP